MIFLTAHTIQICRLIWVAGSQKLKLSKALIISKLVKLSQTSWDLSATGFHDLMRLMHVWRIIRSTILICLPDTKDAGVAHLCHLPDTKDISQAEWKTNRSDIYLDIVWSLCKLCTQGSLCNSVRTSCWSRGLHTNCFYYL